MSEIKVIKENEHGILVECDELFSCPHCKHNETIDCFTENRFCNGGRYLTEQEEKEYYLNKDKK